MAKKKKKTGSQPKRQKKARRPSSKGRRQGGDGMTGAAPDEGGGGERSGGGGGGGGGLMGMRSGIQGLFGSGGGAKKPKTALSRVIDIGIWVLGIGLLLWVIYTRFIAQS